MGLLDYKRYGIIFMTETGREIGKFLLERHRILEIFLKNLGAGDSILIETELIEHNVTADTLRKIECLNSYFDSYPEFRQSFEEFRKNYVADSGKKT